jgi:aspartyl-tRNA(Asn)/glutamyl-tRNA(Gln) amidotransferase subunit A
MKQWEMVIGGACPRDFPMACRSSGLQLIGDDFSEARLLNVAHRYQQATDWHRRRQEID